MLQHRRRRVHCNDILRAAASPFWHCQSATWIRATVYASIDFEPPIASFKELLRPNREHFFLSSLHWKDQPLRIGSDYVHGTVAQAVSARVEHGQDAQAAPAVDTALDAPAHVTALGSSSALSRDELFAPLSFSSRS